jgi:hypothetical protein
MQNVNARPTIPLIQSNKSFPIAVILVVVLMVIGISTYNAFRAAQVQPLPQTATVLSQPMLAEQYGLGVNLVAVTAAGGMVDLRLKITDSQKAKALLGDQANFPTLRASNGVVLQAAQDIASQPIKFEDGGNIFVLYPNGQNAVKSGDPVTIVFGGIQVEPIPAK